VLRVRCRAARRWAVVLCACAVTLVAVAPVGAQVDPEVTQLSNDLTSVRRDLEATSARIMGIRDQQAVLEIRIGELFTHIDEFRAQISTTEAEIQTLEANREAILAIVRGRAARVYVHRDPVSPFDELLLDSPMELARRQALAAAIARRDESTREQLKETTAQLATVRTDLTNQRDALEAQQADLQLQQRALDDLRAQMQSEQARLDAQAKDVQARLQAAIAAGIIRAGGPSLIGPTGLTAQQMAAWWRAQRYPTPNLTVSIDELAQIYVEEGTSENVRADLAFAQAVLETGGFKYTAPGNNLAGMGWCDTCETGRVFPTARDGVRAQIQHLKNYGDPLSRASGLAHPASIYWYAPTSLSQPVANQNFDTFFAKGWALTWNQMGHGNWATDPNYSDKVVKLYASMVAFAQAS
jgi:predicted  nucleic acid-binding Zn-ribbon protein